MLGIGSLVLAPGSGRAAGSITDLGKPTRDVSASDYFPLDGFHRIKTSLTSADRPELLFIAAQDDAASAIERWPLVKALDQFGTLSHVGTAITTLPAAAGGALTTATFSLAHATYRSRYLAFVHKDVLDGQGKYYQTLDAAEHALYVHYARQSTQCGPDPNDPEHYRCTVDNAAAETSHKLPLILIGRYIQTESQFLTRSVLDDQTATHGLSFSAVQSALQTGQDPFAGSALVPDINGEANIMTALICRADGLQPKKVCGRAVIKTLLKHVK